MSCSGERDAPLPVVSCENCLTQGKALKLCQHPIDPSDDVRSSHTHRCLHLLPHPRHFVAALLHCLQRHLGLLQQPPPRTPQPSALQDPPAFGCRERACQSGSGGQLQPRGRRGRAHGLGAIPGRGGRHRAGSVRAQRERGRLERARVGGDGQDSGRRPGWRRVRHGLGGQRLVRSGRDEEEKSGRGTEGVIWCRGASGAAGRLGVRRGGEEVTFSAGAATQGRVARVARGRPLLGASSEASRRSSCIAHTNRTR